MALNIWQAYDKSIELIRAGEKPEAAIFHALQYEIDYEHDAEQMLLYWHWQRTRPFTIKGGYPKVGLNLSPAQNAVLNQMYNRGHVPQAA